MTTIEHVHHYLIADVATDGSFPARCECGTTRTFPVVAPPRRDHQSQEEQRSLRLAHRSDRSYLDFEARP